ncbi:hypothetical protein HRbin08_01867 [bacterium HR08]|nr:hypothetical protein HRbin08_01867 [bacterium HR08]
MIARDRIRDVLQEHRLARARWGDDQSPLPFPDGRQQVQDARGEIPRSHLHPNALAGIEGGEVIEGDSLPVPLRRFVIDRLHLDEREIPLAIARRAHLPGDDVTRAQVKTPDLRGRDVHVLGTGQIAVFGRAQEPESLREAFEHPLDEEQTIALGLRAQDPDDQLLFAEMHRVHDPQIMRDPREPRQAQLPQFAHLQCHRSPPSPQDLLRRRSARGRVG